MVNVILTDNTFHDICGCDLKCTIRNCIFYDQDLKVYYDMYYCDSNAITISNCMFKCDVYYTYFKGNVSNSNFYKKLGENSTNLVVLGKVDDCYFYKEIKSI